MFNCNDGLSDIVGVIVSTSEIGQFTSKAVVTSGNGWNVFQRSNLVKTGLTLVQLGLSLKDIFTTVVVYVGGLVGVVI